MSNRKKISKDLRKRTTTDSGEGVTITPPVDSEPGDRPVKSYAGIPWEPDEDEALKMGYAIADAVFGRQARDARATKD